MIAAELELGESAGERRSRLRRITGGSEEQKVAFEDLQMKKNGTYAAV